MTVCAHRDQVQIRDAPASVAGCEECLAAGNAWVHLRMCQTCGHVGCCDDSPHRHATAHHLSTGHPIIRSLEPGEDWSWCYVDRELLGPLGDGGPPPDEAADMPDELNPRHLTRRLVELGVFALLVVGAISLLPGLGDVRQRFADADPACLVVAGIAELGSCLSYVAAFRGVFCRGMGWRFSYELGMAEQGTNVLLPAGGAGGLALGAWALRQGGMPTNHIARRTVAFFLITSTPNFVVAAVVGAVLAIGLLPGEAPLAPTVALAGLAAATIALVLAIPRTSARRAARRAERPPRDTPTGRIRAKLPGVAAAISAGVDDSVALIRSRDRLALVGSVGYMAFDIAALAAAFAAFGGAPRVGPLVFAYVIGQLGGLIPLPGGIGGTDGGLIGALVLYGTPLSTATAAVLAYRAFQLGLPAILGATAFVQLHRTLARDPAPAALCFPLAEPVAEVEAPAMVAGAR
jgi:uncharacterized membrane protein YbhN (UPF0104 family)